MKKETEENEEDPVGIIVHDEIVIKHLAPFLVGMGVQKTVAICDGVLACSKIINLFHAPFVVIGNHLRGADDTCIACHARELHPKSWIIVDVGQAAKHERDDLLLAIGVDRIVHSIDQLKEALVHAVRNPKPKPVQVPKPVAGNGAIEDKADFII